MSDAHPPTVLGLAAMLLGGFCAFGNAPALSADETSAPSSPAAVFRYDAKDRRDPFVPLVRDGRIVGVLGRAEDSAIPVLYGILWEAGGESVALIDHREARIGDPVGEYEVVAIHENTVVLSKGGEPLVLRMVFEHAPVAPPSRRTKRR